MASSAQLLCLVCESNLENCWHNFINYDRAQQCWQKTHLWQAMEAISIQVENFAEFVSSCFQSLSVKEMEACVREYVEGKKHRLMGKQIVAVDQVVFQATKVLTQWSGAQAMEKSLDVQRDRELVVALGLHRKMTS